MPSPGGQFLSDQFGDIEDYFISDYTLIDQYIGDTLWSWGGNPYGQLGVNDNTNRSTPVTTILGGVTWKFSSAGNTISAAVKSDGTLWVWGGNEFGQLGINDTADRSTPVTTMLGGTDWKSVSCGNNHITAIKIDGTLWVWGRNNQGQIGVNDTTNRLTPVTTILGGTDWRLTSGSGNSAAVKTDGTLWIWGNNAQGQLGINETGNRSTPITTLLGGTNWKQVDCGGVHVVAIKTDGTLWAWGRNNWGQMGVNDTTDRYTPVTTLLGGTSWRFTKSGNAHLTAIKTDGTLWTWGRNDIAQLGVNDTSARSTPTTTLAGGNNWKYTAGGGYHTTAIKTDGTLWTWGSNNSGQLGVNDNNNRSTPVTTSLGGTNWKSVNCGVLSNAQTAVTAGQLVDFS